jgi:hypothetical protein
MDDEVVGAVARAGLLDAEGGRGTIEVEAVPTLAHSSVVRVVVRRGDGTALRLMLKRSGGEAGAFLTVREVGFYRGVAPLLPGGLAPRCYLSEAEGNAALLLLEDLGATHHASDATPPAFEDTRSFVEALAELHAAGERLPSLADDWAREVGGGVYDTLEGRLALRGAIVGPFVEQFGGELDAWTRELVAGLQRGPQALLEFAKGRTVMHGDAHYGNGLYRPGSAALIDWGNACLGPGEADLAHAVALNLPRDIGRVWEAALLAAYTARLNERGIARTVEETMARYRLGVLYAVTVPMGHWRSGVPEQVWRALFGNVVAAAKELAVGELV